jgi:hypothetical protein
LQQNVEACAPYSSSVRSQTNCNVHLSDMNVDINLKLCLVLSSYLNVRDTISTDDIEKGACQRLGNSGYYFY